MSAPTPIGAAAQSGTISYSFHDRRCAGWGAPPAAATIRRVVERWEQIALHRWETEANAHGQAP